MHEQSDIHELERDQQEQNSIERPAGEIGSRLAPLGPRVFVGEDRDRDHEQPKERRIPGVRRRHQEAQGREWEHEAQEVPRPEGGNDPQRRRGVAGDGGGPRGDGPWRRCGSADERL